MTYKQLLLLSLIIFLSIVSWIAFDLYHAGTTVTITPSQQELTNPLTPTFDGDIILKIKSREN